MFRLKTLSKIFKQQPSTILDKIAIKYRQKFYCRYDDDSWFEFPRLQDIIVPLPIAQRISNDSKGVNKLFYAASSHKLNELTFLHLDQTSKIPVIAILGHFNHGKTTLLDTLLNVNNKKKLVETEKFGITQEVRTRQININAFRLNTNDSLPRYVTMVDTPGQDIFYRMRNSGASVADMALLVIGADEGISDQTEESIGIIESLGIPVLVCVNKIDHESVQSDPSRIASLSHEIRQYVTLEHAPIVHISAKERINIDGLVREMDQLLDHWTDSRKRTDSHSVAGSPMILTDEVQRISGVGSIVDISRSKKTGTTLQVIVKHGQIGRGDLFVAGGWSGHVRSLFHDAEDSPAVSIEKAFSGWGVTVAVTLHDLIDEPRPIGDNVYFFGLIEQETLKKTDAYRAFNEDLMLSIMDYNQMSHSFERYKLQEDQIQSYRLREEWVRLKGSQQQGRTIHQDSEVGGCDEVSMEEEEEEDRSGPALGSTEGSRNVVIKCDSDLSLSTILDAADDAMQDYCHRMQQQDSDDPEAVAAVMGRTRSPGIRSPCRIVRSGLGEVGKDDVLVAVAAQAEIIALNVSDPTMIHRFGLDDGSGQVHRVLLNFSENVSEVIEKIRKGN